MFYGEGSGTILLDDLDCTGDEKSLLDCVKNVQNRNSDKVCDHSEDAGVKCEGM